MKRFVIYLIKNEENIPKMLTIKNSIIDATAFVYDYFNSHFTHGTFFIKKNELKFEITKVIKKEIGWIRSIIIDENVCDSIIIIDELFDNDMIKHGCDLVTELKTRLSKNNFGLVKPDESFIEIKKCTLLDELKIEIERRKKNN